MSRYLSIGLFVTLIATATVFYVLRTSSTIGLGETYTVYAYVDDASGLLVDSVVRLAGVDVGRLASIELDGNQARLALRIRRGVQLYEDAVVSKATESILGTATVSINAGSGQGALLQDGHQVQHVRQMANVADAVESANQLATSATRLVDEFHTFLQDGETVDALNDIVAVARETAFSVSMLLQENLTIARDTLLTIQSMTGRVDAGADDKLAMVQQILESTAQLTARLDRMVGENESGIVRSIEEVEANLVALRDVIASVQGSADNVSHITGVVRDGEGNLGQLIHDDELYTRAVRITEKAEEFLDATVGMGVQVDFRSELLMDQVETKDRFDLRLVPRTGDRYYTFGLINTPVPVTTEKTVERDVTGTGGTSPEQTVTRTVKQEDEMKFNLQMARVWGPLTIRAGVMESTPGIGIDISPVKRVMLSGEAFDFGADDGIYLRAFGQFYPFYDPESNNPLQWLYFTGGVDDAMDVYHRDFFLGAGVRFTDHDLRGLVGFIPVQ
ncbi:phospholipid/cholesterol/gamma-HCH transport system substrate-binding protein [Alkalispirochaeta americana]|uniref:Phospholipid/cholesterol/gamma-HCH transport system substrate-binding protein n=1 Tax=Alkalispirochaeta americana TaxID=159291 RepID=A0A1N6T1E0_9SPIO|nr:MlaD family protein [Alkalispirochaeta americana]SIQ47037.1 phospholipid/cholesterol/gamma-HCH transport system substrate-binding protein [Alkalispirochaeta americana]